MQEINTILVTLGNAAVLNDKKTEFLRAMSDWVKKWEQEKFPNCEKFGLSAQTSNTLKRTLLCHASLIEDLLKIRWLQIYQDSSVSK